MSPNPLLCTAFFITRTRQGRDDTTLARFEMCGMVLSVLELIKNTDCSRRVLAIGGAFFDARSIGDPVMRDQRSNFREIENFSALRAYISKTINRSYIKLHQRVPRPILKRIKCWWSLLMEYLWRIASWKDSVTLCPEARRKSGGQTGWCRLVLNDKKVIVVNQASMIPNWRISPANEHITVVIINKHHPIITNCTK